VTNRPQQRVSGIRGPDSYAPPSRPPDSAGAAAQDAYRQTRFVLGADLDLFAESMDLQLALLKDAYQRRTLEAAAIMPLWSRAYTYLNDGMLLATRASYASILPLVRAAAEVIAAQEGLRGGEMDMHHQWLTNTLAPEERFKAIEFHLGRYFAGEVLAKDATLRSVYRPASDLGRPAFGASLLQVAPESNNNRLAIAFADASFHLGWAELTLGWLLALSTRQLGVVCDASAVFDVSDERRTAHEDLQRRVGDVLTRGDRCRIEEIEDRGDRRYLVHNFRRSAGGSLKKVLL
jgi:hypothetical protein